MPRLETMDWDRAGKVARIVLNRPHVLNAMNNQATKDLNAIAEAIMLQSEVKVVVLTGEGRSFSSGIDLKELSADQISTAYHQRWERALRLFETMEKIVIAGIKEYCLGGGLQLAIACDIRVAADNAMLGLPAIKEGLIPGLAPYRLPRYIGLGRAKELILSGRTISAHEAHAMGLVDEVVPLPEFEARLEELTQRYARLCTVATVKSKLLCSSFDSGYEPFLQKYLDYQEIAQSSEDHLEAKRAYLEKREPLFR